MKLKNKDVISLLMVLSLVFYEPVPSGEAQIAFDTLPKVNVDTSGLLKNDPAIPYVDTVEKTINQFSNLMNRTKKNARVAGKQIDHIEDQIEDIHRQQKIIDSLEKKVVNKKKSDGTTKATTDTTAVSKPRGIKSWKIFHIFNKKS